LPEPFSPMGDEIFHTNTFEPERMARFVLEPEEFISCMIVQKTLEREGE